MKGQARILGIDDGPFVKDDDTVPLVGVLICPPSYVEGVMVSSCHVDGEDANSAVIDMVRGSRFSEQVRAVMIDGAAFGGFNVVDVPALSKALALPVITVSRDLPDLRSIASALKAHFPDWDRRLDIISSVQVRSVGLPQGIVHIASAGIDEAEADRVVKGCVVRGCLPEPIRLAHLMATALVRGESKGKA
ncbi:MAG: DUF99 family protein [Methanomassiliicoccales archaeon]|nr:DUF99 family protein [Methanomassiliicoccales archaeon]